MPPGPQPGAGPDQQTDRQQPDYQQADYQQAQYQPRDYGEVQQPQYQPTRQWQPQDQPSPGQAAWQPQDQTPPGQAAWQPQDQTPPGQAAWQPQDQVPAGPGQWQPQDQAAGGQGQWPSVTPPGAAAGGAADQALGRAGRRPRRRRMRRSFWAGLTVVVVLILLLIADRVGNAVAENEMATQFVSKGFPVKPSVSIEGFPFLTQLISKDFSKVDISASNVPAGPVTISTVHATINGMHISSFSSNASARVDQLTATAFISFGSILSASGIGNVADVQVTPDGPDTLKLTADVAGVPVDTEEAKITQTGPQTISVTLLDNGNGIGAALGSVLGSASSFSFNLPKGVPASLRITGLTLNDQGLTLSASASNATFSQ
jgi:hypothetical protein